MIARANRNQRQERQSLMMQARREKHLLTSATDARRTVDNEENPDSEVAQEGKDATREGTCSRAVGTHENLIAKREACESN